MYGCAPKPSTDEGKVAQVHNTILYQKDLASIIPSGTAAQDSVVLINSYIEKWIRQQLMVQEAETKVTQDPEINHLVKEYRSSLLKHKYEQIIIEDNLDTVITKTELNSNYLANKSQYILTEPIMRCVALSIPATSEFADKIENVWAQNQVGKAKSFARKIASNLNHLDEKIWITTTDLYSIIPYEQIKKEKLEKSITLEMEDSSNKYFLKIYDYVDKNLEPPLDYIALQLKKVILHKRKQKILKEKLENTYESELRKNNIKVF